MKKALLALAITLLLLVSACSSSSQTVTQIHGTPVRVDYTSGYAARIHFAAGEVLAVYSDEPIAWETLLYSHRTFNVVPYSLYSHRTFNVVPYSLYSHRTFNVVPYFAKEWQLVTIDK